MADHQRLMKQGLLTEKRAELKRVEDLAEGAIDTIQTRTFVVSSVFDLDTTSILTHAQELDRHVKNGNEIRAQIAKLEDELGIG
jgi:hypothetical protein